MPLRSMTGFAQVKGEVMNKPAGDGSRNLVSPSASANGHLGFAPMKPESFALGVAAGPEFIAADSGSDDIGPGPREPKRNRPPYPQGATHNNRRLRL